MTTTGTIAVSRDFVESLKKALEEISTSYNDLHDFEAASIDVGDGDPFQIDLATIVADIRNKLDTKLNTKPDDLRAYIRKLQEMLDYWDETEASNRTTASFYSYYMS